jgi:hypothetical protein
MKKIQMKISYLPLLMIPVLSACSTMESAPVKGEIQKLGTNGPYAVVVKAGAISPIVYEYAIREFGKKLEVTEGADSKGRIEITFASTSDSAWVGVATSTSVTNFNGNGWYSGNIAYANGQVTTAGSSISSGSSLTWQNSTMLVVIRDAEGKRVWTADYVYKGGWELSGFYVNTAEEAARYTLQKVVAQLAKDTGNQ